MSSGRAHTKATLAVTPVTAIAAIALTDANIALVGGAVVGSLLSIAVNPDCDQESFSYIEWRMLKSVIGVPHIAFWYPYALSLWHREPWSHFPIIGTLLRVVYMSLIPLVTIAFLQAQGYVIVKLVFIGVLYYLLSRRKLFFLLMFLTLIALIFAFTAASAPLQLAIIGAVFGLTVSDILHWIMDGLPH